MRPVEEYQAHLNQIAEELGCTLVQAPRLAGMMYVEFGYVEGPIIGQGYGSPQIDYFINLHELGHVYHKHTQGRPPKQHEKFYFENGVLKSEAQAWDFAFVRSLDTIIEDRTRSFMWNTCLGSYYSGYKFSGGSEDRILSNGNRHYVKFKYDEPDDYFISVVKLIKGKYFDEKNPFAFFRE